MATMARRGRESFLETLPTLRLISTTDREYVFSFIVSRSFLFQGQQRNFYRDTCSSFPKSLVPINGLSRHYNLKRFTGGMYATFSTVSKRFDDGLFLVLFASSRSI